MLVLSLCLHLFSLTLYLLITAVFVINYVLECFTYVVIAYIHLSTHILFVYKHVLVLLKLGVKTFLVFYSLIELSNMKLLILLVCLLKMSISVLCFLRNYVTLEGNKVPYSLAQYDVHILTFIV